MSEGEKEYVMYNKITKARIRCTANYVAKWLALGFEVESIEDKKDNSEE